MTKFEELSEAIAKKNNSKKEYEDNDSLEVEVAGTETTKKPLVSFGDDETDKDLIDQLYSSVRNRVPKGENATGWDQD